jgi:hypothetical protein
MGDADAALELVDGMLSRIASSIGVARVEALVKRVRAHALLQRGDLPGARQALEASLAAARARRNIFDLTLTLLSLIELHRREGFEPPPQMVDESKSLLDTLKIRAVPAMPRAV